MAKHEFGIMMNTPKQNERYYYGVTLVPPCSLKMFIDIIADIPELCE